MASVDEELKLALEHTRQMFIYHAQQRHGSLNFYFTLATALFGGSSALFAANDLWKLPAFVAPVLMTLLEVAAVWVMQYFIWLDERNASLVDADKAALALIEEKLSAGDTNFCTLKGSEEFRNKYPHKTYKIIVINLLRVFQGAATVAVVGAWVYYWMLHPRAAQ